jgi:putative ABC transport system substrate-binding protein
MRRRKFIILLGAMVVGCPLPLRAQQQAMPVVGFLHYGSPNKLAHLAAAVRQGLQEAGYIEHQNVALEYRWGEEHYGRLAALAADLVQRRVDVIVAGGNVPAQAAKNATTAIPIVFTSGADPVKSGLVPSLSRPGANLTGWSMIAQEMATKRLELMRELLPNVRTIAMLINPKFAGAEAELHDVETAGRSMGLKILRLTASNDSEIDAAFVMAAKERVEAAMIGTDGYLVARREQIAALATRHAMPTIYPYPDFPVAGGLISYGPSLTDGYRHAGVYAGRILKGASPADLPVVQPTKFDLVINLKTANAIGLTIQPIMLMRADQVIE